ncbi:hypothetical protein [Saccharopolyspora phatthalungensis]|uniref:Aminoglycoside phosphotransferase domain-containing protein n=1 Tax=Saccharopolyspora phatthalungensis TaxID=664693 RepID=A0A840QJS4_9PSEU|nr:hypothetical protein [Saccharopolyspora phatthalungensis]MBB5159608.1 hypothetical protein [Saccharopolyspora phatthalungensis]
MAAFALESELERSILDLYGAANLSDLGPDYLSHALEKRGNSGALITLMSDGLVRKTGQPDTVVGARVVSQGQWILQHSNPALPRVHDVFQDGSGWGYTMERLDTVPLELLDGRKLAAVMVQLLQDHFWCKPAEVEFDEAAHAERLAPIVQPLTGKDRTIFQQLYDRVEWDKLTTGLTHGDPVFQNVLFAPDCSMVLCDPILSTPALPDVIAVDVAHIFLSCVGYERLTYRLPGPGNIPLDSIASMAALTPEDLIASLYFAVMCVLRAMVYVSPETAKILLEECMGRLIGEAACHV